MMRTTGPKDGISLEAQEETQASPLVDLYVQQSAPNKDHLPQPTHTLYSAHIKCSFIAKVMWSLKEDLSQ